MHRDRRMLAWHKWCETLTLLDDRLIDKWELEEARAELFTGLAPMQACRHTYLAYLQERGELEDNAEHDQ